MPIEEYLVDRLAEAIHEHYLAVWPRDERLTAATTPWRLLDEGTKESNRDQARDIGAKLASIGCSVSDGSIVDTFAFTTDELDRLAQEEHGRWSRQRRSAGWEYGPERDDAAKQHPSLVSWPELTESEKDKDRDAVRNIPAILATAGLRVVRDPPPADPA